MLNRLVGVLIEDAVYVRMLKVGVAVPDPLLLEDTVVEGETLIVFVSRVERDPDADIVDVRLIVDDRVYVAEEVGVLD
jgi:hypothetical protein